MLFNSDNSSNQKQLKEYEIMCFPNKKRNFGSFTGNTSKQSAEKAFTFLSNLTQDEIKKDGNFIVFSIRKKNNKINNTNKEHKFIGTVIELENKVINSEKVLKYKNVISKYNTDLDKIKSKNKNIKYNDQV